MNFKLYESETVHVISYAPLEEIMKF